MSTLIEYLKIHRFALCAGVVLVVGGCATSGTRESVPVDLSGHYAVPTEVSTTATGTATIEVTASGWVSGSVWVQNVAATAVELGEGPIGQQGTAIVSLVRTSENTWVVPDGVRLSGAQYETFMAGGLYVNVRSAAYSEGEIRGQITPAACRIKVEPEPVVAAPPPPEPVVAAPPAPAPVPQKLTASTDFDFDKATLRDEGKAKLDDFANALHDQQYNGIHITGYTDRIGSDAYNQGLSVRRANAVEHYLIDKGISADHIEAEGRGKSDPLTGDTCNGIRGKKLIDCLQPDRRVEVEVR
jgi:outer membrane protein OmpA-like peptidoglycan-associated protein